MSKRVCLKRNDKGICNGADSLPSTSRELKYASSGFIFTGKRSRSPELIVRSRLSSKTEFKASIQRGSIDPSSIIIGHVHGSSLLFNS